MRSTARRAIRIRARCWRPSRPSIPTGAPPSSRSAAIPPIRSIRRRAAVSARAAPSPRRCAPNRSRPWRCRWTGPAPRAMRSPATCRRPRRTPRRPAVAEPAVAVEDLTVRFVKREGTISAVNGVSFALAQGEVMTILGESGSGKSVTLKALMGLLPAYARLDGTIRVGGRDLAALSPPELRKLRGGTVSMIFQEPITALDPVYTIGEQIAETIVQHEGVDRTAAAQRAIELLERVKIP